ncbi:efflux RND transporter periplasmic adaptor subunit [Aquabacterium olei]|uniref:Efflux RND transporter periplasmic adaptor subunit n=1 Tax=Aquabacterium olei TaxID=1296669 RepID=A0A2U8FXN6_9BURK|nr:efflux RND transporter periplasmic adaptor subunit [Aquabacterium olei]AWI55204.1 efflux RND transporter periplasmic adaptor subunit [Aquabacterium olei]
MSSSRRSRPRRSLRLPFVLAVSALLAACGKPAESPAPVRSVRTLVVAETGGQLEREFAGEVRARTESRLGFQVGGKVVRRMVDSGQTVRKGQPLAQLDAQDLRLSQDAARAGVAAAEAQATQATADLRRFTDLKAQGFISQAQLDRYQAMATAAEASLRQARAQAGVQGNQAGYATLVADAPGVITGVELEPGQVVSPGLPVLTLAHDGPRDVLFHVPEDMGPTLRGLHGRAGGVQVRRWGTSEWVPATVREVAAAADTLTRTYLVKADVASARGFELGQTATVRLMASVRAQEGVRVPLQAVAEREGKSVVWVLDGNSMTVKPVPVVTADVVGNMVLISRGVTPGQELVTAGAHVLSPGQKVRRYEGRIGVSQPAASSAAPAASRS